MNFIRLMFMALMAGGLGTCAGAAAAGTGGGDEVVVIYNSNVRGSKKVADHYAQARQVPRGQVYGFPLPPSEEISRAEFRELLQQPLAQKLEADDLWTFRWMKTSAIPGQPGRQGRLVATSQIRYAVLCYGVPLKIRPDPGIHEAGRTNLQAELRHDEAAVDSELALLPLINLELPLTGPQGNSFYGATNAADLHPTNGILLVARLDGPHAGDCLWARGQGAGGGAGRAMGPDLF